MLTRKILWSVLVIIAILLIPGCESDDNGTSSSSKTPEPPTFSLKTMHLPAYLEASSNPDAQKLKDCIADAQDLETYGCCFDAPAEEQRVEKSYTEPEWTLEWEQAGLQKELKITSQNERVTWDMYLTGTFDGESVTNWLRMEVIQRGDRSNGHATLYKAGTNNIEYEWVWYTFDSGEYKFIRNCFHDDQSKVVISLKADRSGTIEIHGLNSKGALEVKTRYTWYVNGKGEWWTYQDGSQTDHGVWG